MDAALNIPTESQQVRINDIVDRVFQFGNYTAVDATTATGTVTILPLGQGQLAKLGALIVNGSAV